MGKPDFLLIALLIIAAAAAGIFFIGARGEAEPTALGLAVGIDSTACSGTVKLDAELKDGSGERVPDALVGLYAGDELLDSLYTDRNGRVSGEFKVDRRWCGKKTGFRASFGGAGRLLASEDAEQAAIRAPSNIVLSIPENATEGEVFAVEAKLADALDGDPIPDRFVNLGALSVKTDANGTAIFTMSFNDSGSGEIYAYFEGSELYEPAESARRKLTIAPLMCEDGTEVGECSGSYLCAEGQELEFDCGACGCPSGTGCIGGVCLSEEERLLALIERLQESSVKIQSDEGIGSGVIIGRNGSTLLILTNRHVVDEDFAFDSNTNLEVLNYTNETAKPVRIYIAPNQLDMAIVAVEKDIGPPAAISHEKPKVGARVLAIGSPLGIPNSVTSGIVSNFVLTNTSSGFDFEVMQTDAAVNPGNSGGGVFLAGDGSLLGIISFKLVLRGNQLAEGLGFAIPAGILDDYPLQEWKAIPPN